mgnify:CR=1 FL=1|tara:strand:+ start:83 stop:619 length:537 start_codon:yes stop_codon:yes gene_type:complete
MGITKDGDKVEKKAEKLVGSMRINPDKSAIGKAKGDVIVALRNNSKIEFYAESKKNTMNQTRPCKYIPHFVQDDKAGDWFVIPPDDLVKMALGRKGQHAKDSMEVVGLGEVKRLTKAGNPTRWEKYYCEPQELEIRLWEAYEQGERNKKLKEYCASFRKRVEERAEQTQSELKVLLHG